MTRLTVSIKEAAAALGVSTSSVWRWARAGELPSVRIGGRRLIPCDALRRRIEAPSVNPNTTPARRGAK